MPKSDFRSSSSWQSAIDLGPLLMELAEAMPATEELGLSWQLRQSMVEIPAAIALEQTTDSEPQLMPALKLIAALELIDKVYPALDTAAARAAADALVERLFGGKHDEPIHARAPDPAPKLPSGHHPAQPTAAAPSTEAVDNPAPASVPILEPPAHNPVSVPVQPAAEPTDHEPDVHPDHGQ
jgi:hypothetical protein